MAEHQPPKDSRDDDPSLLENLKQAGGALGGVVSEFTGNYRADREAAHDQGGEHALDDPDEEEGTVAEHQPPKDSRDDDPSRESFGG